MSIGGRNAITRTCAGAGLVILFGVAPGAASAAQLPGSPHPHARTWLATAGPATTMHTDALSGVSCTRAGQCVAVGFSQVGTVRKTLAESLAGHTWRVENTRNPVGATVSELTAVSCPSTSTCVAVGDSGANFNNLRPLAERLTGTTWRLLKIPAPAGATSSSLRRVSCPTPTDCLAVGVNEQPGNVTLPLAELWNGHRWHVLRPLAPAGATFTLFSGVSCVASAWCIGAGVTQGVTIAERWNGSGWRRLATPNPTGVTSSELLSVSCVGRASCMAVGFSFLGPKPLAESWNGRTWRLLASPSPVSAGVFLLHVSCIRSSRCIAVGSAVTNVTQSPLAQRWNGLQWRLQTVPDHAGATVGLLAADSCPTASNCIAVGTYGTGSGSYFTLAEAWNGHTWKLLSPRNP